MVSRSQRCQSFGILLPAMGNLVLSKCCLGGVLVLDPRYMVSIPSLFFERKIDLADTIVLLQRRGIDHFDPRLSRSSALQFQHQPTRIGVLESLRRESGWIFLLRIHQRQVEPMVDST